MQQGQKGDFCDNRNVDGLKNMSIVQVALDVPLSTLFDYTVAEGVGVEVGQRVIVPFGKRQLVGVVMECVGTTEVSAERIKPVTQVLHDSAPLSAGLLDLLRFCSDYYRFPIGQTVLSGLPTRLRSDKPVISKPILSYRLSAKGLALDLENPPRKKNGDSPVGGGADVRLLPQSAGYASNVSQPFPKRKVVQRRILAKLAEHPCNLAQIKALSATVGAQLKALVQEGWVESFTSVHLPSTSSGRTVNSIRQHTFDNAHTLTVEQQQAVNAVTQASGYSCFLLHGITGSGKTEVYVHLMHDVLQRGGQVLLLVPEINLTPQLENYFHSRFPDVNLVSLHSGLSEGERLHNWQQAQLGCGADRARHTAVGVRRVACIGVDHRGRGARQFVQAAGRLALFGARRGDLPRQSTRCAYRAGFSHAVAGELPQRAERALPDAQADRARAGRSEPAQGAQHQHHPDGDAPRHQREPAARDRAAHRAS